MIIIPRNINILLLLYLQINFKSKELMAADRSSITSAIIVPHMASSNQSFRLLIVRDKTLLLARSGNRKNKVRKPLMW